MSEVKDNFIKTLDNSSCGIGKPFNREREQSRVL
jgi:hypothetical protein